MSDIIEEQFRKGGIDPKLVIQHLFNRIRIIEARLDVIEKVLADAQRR